VNIRLNSELLRNHWTASRTSNRPYRNDLLHVRRQSITQLSIRIKAGTRKISMWGNILWEGRIEEEGMSLSK